MPGGRYMLADRCFLEELKETGDVEGELIERYIKGSVNELD